MKPSTSALALTLASSACGPPAGPLVEAPMAAASAAGPDARSTPAPTVRGGEERPDAASLRGASFVGVYWCAQGETALRLDFGDVEDDGSAEAIFLFEVPGAPPVRGGFLTRGVYDRATGRLALSHVTWVDQPPGYVMVDLLGTMGSSGAISGTVIGPGCTTFTLRRAN